MNMIESLTPQQARKLARPFSGYAKGPVSLTVLTRLDAATAKMLVAMDTWDGHLPGLTAIDAPNAVEIAKALATRPGNLSLPNLEKIFPKTLAALIEKRDVKIPRIETSDLIQEPDGSVTEDFV